ncbi:hypothetical protein D9611_011585 [Ephemerocybe angulata]|uniref:Uncharacterized protein n=1 Tax=Ephemerocybe angulata TaxID=980116 RepID=A0A8H5AV55_9AGAR|nr:hypothetical protein D9611_011585 [Tulosesus angulatus]
MTIHRPLPSFALAVSQICEATAEDVLREFAFLAPPRSESVDIMKTIDCRTDPVYDNHDDDYWRFKHRASSDYEVYCSEYEDDADTQTLFDDPMPVPYGMKLSRQSHSRNADSERQPSKSLSKLPSTLKSALRKIRRTGKVSMS